ncbi:MAG TPA: hypothetical protein VII28_04510 [Puia sp.]
MNFFSRLFNRSETPPLHSCPRCLGKGHVDKDDIIRLKQQGKWRTGVCAYCQGTGKVNRKILSNVAPDATHLTTALSDTVRDFIINKTQLDGCPVTELERLWLENGFQLLLGFFGRKQTEERRIRLPHPDDFPIFYDASEQSAVQTMKIVALQMEVPDEMIHLLFYNDRIPVVSTGDPFGGKIHLGSMDLNQRSSGVYSGKNEEGKYDVGINREILPNAEKLVATLAHEIAHIKLLGEDRLKVNNEQLTDLVTAMFGLGVFNANVAFRTFKDFYAHGWSAQGYLTQKQWGYALALFAHVRGEISPGWIRYLTPNLHSDFLQSQQFILDNRDIVFRDIV